MYQLQSDTILYKVIPIKYFTDAVNNQYLYFRRVNAYQDDALEKRVIDNVYVQNNNAINALEEIGITSNLWSDYFVSTVSTSGF